MPSSLAYFRLEGVLVRRRSVACAAWMAARHIDLLGRAGRVGWAALAAPLQRAVPPDAATRWAWRPLRGCSEDRVVVLGEDYARTQLLPRLHAPGVALWERCRAQGDRLVLITDHPRVVVDHLAAHLGADEVIGNRLEIVGGEATGALVPPVITGRLDGGWVHRHARTHGVPPTRCRAYGAHADDATLLSGVGLPCAVTPAPGLRRLAATFDWPTIEA